MNAGDDRERSGAMSVATHVTELLDPRDQLRAFWEELDIPHGWRAEILEGTIVVSPAPANRHNLVASMLHEQFILHFHNQHSWRVFQTQAVELRATGDVYIPDLVVYPQEKHPIDGVVTPAEHALLVVEITSPSNAEHDRKRKVWGYAHGPVPLYLLVDPHASDGPQVMLYSRPKDGTYQTVEQVSYGEEIRLPAPFDLTVDTSIFPTK
jgi:Uma2 family endonuclease